MDLNFNIPPADSRLPASIIVTVESRSRHEVDGVQVEGELKTALVTKKPIHVAQAVIADGATEPSYKCLCSDGSYETIPLSAFTRADGATPAITSAPAEAVPATEAPAAPVTAEAPAPVEETK